MLTSTSLCVGKSSLTVQYVDGHFVDSYYPTIENTFSKVIRYRNQDFAVEIIDTAGQDEYTLLNNKHFIGVHGYMIVYSVASKQSFEMVRIIRDKILNHLGAEAVPIMVVANKSDLRPEQRQVSAADGKKVAEELGCGFVEASARYNENVGKAFEVSGMRGDSRRICANVFGPVGYDRRDREGPGSWSAERRKFEVCCHVRHPKETGRYHHMHACAINRTITKYPLTASVRGSTNTPKISERVWLR